MIVLGLKAAGHLSRLEITRSITPRRRPPPAAVPRIAGRCTENLERLIKFYRLTVFVLKFNALEHSGTSTAISDVSLSNATEITAQVTLL
ncbi:hypothetical protein JYU34_003413 [Plutella xylostella]|uniref:Uncharacterized protein n=1 Tax=Plutella xylostella TaxID=51655 RepID=A0ABQ7R004_PLUXY|nr:hypothetical protein JYU34_003413 [Plutella xylostella]